MTSFCDDPTQRAAPSASSPPVPIGWSHPAPERFDWAIVGGLLVTAICIGFCIWGTLHGYDGKPEPALITVRLLIGGTP